MDGIGKAIKNYVFRKVSSGNLVCCFPRSSQPYEVSSIDCVKSVRIRCYSGPHFHAFGLNAERYSVSLRIQSECWKIRTRITPNTDTFNAVIDCLDLKSDKVLIKPQEVVNVDTTHSTFKVHKVVRDMNMQNKFFNMFFHLNEDSQQSYTQYYGLNCRHNSANQQSDGGICALQEGIFIRREMVAIINL